MKDQITSAKNDLWEDLKKQYSIAERNDVSAKISAKIGGWERHAARTLQAENPFYEDEQTLKSAELDLQQNNVKIESIKNDIGEFNSFRKKIKAPADDLLLKQCAALEEESSSAPEKEKPALTDKASEAEGLAKQRLLRKQHGLRVNVQKQWREAVETAVSEWELAQLNDFRRKIFAEISSWLEILQKLYGLLSALSLTPGLLFDLSEGGLTNADIEELKRWAAYVSRDEGVRKLCDMLGRIRQAERRKREEEIRCKTTIKVDAPDVNSKEEIIGITLGKDIENVIPQELALLADDECSFLFDLKFAESRLMCFETQGLRQTDVDVERKKKVQVSNEEKMGPVIICVDTSGSMQGAPETIAKAITLYMATKAASQERNCYLINFSTGIKTLDLSGGMGLEKVIAFLRASFHGGTDVAPALEHALETIKNENYRQSDVLTISDFIMGDLPEALCSDIAEIKKQKNRFFSLCIGDLFMNSSVKTVFDREWVYNPASKGIEEIGGFINKIA